MIELRDYLIARLALTKIQAQKKPGRAGLRLSDQHAGQIIVREDVCFASLALADPAATYSPAP